jgi:hypothetical protein
MLRCEGVSESKEEDLSEWKGERTGLVGG